MDLKTVSIHFKEVLYKVFTITNNLGGFRDLYQKISSVMEDASKIKVGIEVNGHYSYNHDIRMNGFPSSFSKYLVFKNLIPVPKTPLGSY